MAPRKQSKTKPTAEPVNTESRAIRRRRGSLQDLPDFAVEIQLEVFSNLHPRDLLNLARTCKRFRAFFLHPSNDRLWKVACENVDNLPERPPFLSEPAFINLLFFSRCHSCGKPNIRKVIWEWFARYCPGCLTSMSYDYYQVDTKLLRLPHRPLSLNLSQLKDLLGMHVTKTGYGHRRPNLATSKYYRFHKPEVDAFMNELGADGRSISPDTYTEVVQRREADLVQRMQHSARCKAWHEEQHAEWMDGLNTKRKERFEEIVKRLRDVGWDKEIDYLTEEDRLEDMALLPVVQQSSKLTPTAWEKVLVAVNDFLEKARRDRLAKERCAVLRPRLLDLEQAVLSHYVQLPRGPLMDCRPDYVDLAMMDECKAIVDAPESETITREDFAVLMPDLASRWEELRKLELSEAICKYIGSVGEDIDPLALAIAVFPCMRCSRGSQYLAVYHYPDVLAHPCGRNSLYGDLWMFCEGDSLDWNQAVYNKAVCRMASGDRYSKSRHPFALDNMCRSVVSMQRAVKNMRNIVGALGLDPARATVDELRKCEGRVRCVQCSTHWSQAEDCRNAVYTWEAALAHAWSKNALIEHDQWESVGHTDMQTVKKLEESTHAGFPSFSTPGSVWACSLCVDWDGLGPEVSLHQLSQHLTQDFHPAEDGVFYMHPGKSVGVIRPPVVLP